LGFLTPTISLGAEIALGVGGQRLEERREVWTICTLCKAKGKPELTRK
jgi:hypothetical protein